MALLKIDEAADAYQVHRTTLYRALRENRLHRRRPRGASGTWVDSNEVERLVRPGRLTEAELLDLVDHVKEVFFEEFDDALTAHEPPASLEASIVRQLARFLNSYRLEPGPDFADAATAGVMYESHEPHYRDRPKLNFIGMAQQRNGDARWSFSLNLGLARDLNALVGDGIGLAATARFTNPAR